MAYRKEYMAQWRNNNREKVRQWNKESTLRTREWWAEIKSTLACIKCGENHPACLDFHHRDPNEKEHTISFMLRRCSRKKILEELQKCDVLCANCHRKEHFKGV